MNSDYTQQSQYSQHKEQHKEWGEGPAPSTDTSTLMKVVFGLVFLCFVYLAVRDVSGSITFGDPSPAPVPCECEKAAEPPQQTASILWLARALHTETIRPEEMWVIGWVIRNRVEMGYHGKHTYREVILEPFQFSAFNLPASREKYSRLTWSDTTRYRNFAAAVQVAREVIDSPAWKAPVPKTATHFYAQVGMKGRGHPAWAEAKYRVKISGVNPERLRVFALPHHSRG